MAIEIRGLTPYLEVFDMATSLGFYRDKLGFELANSNDPSKARGQLNWVLLRMNGAELMLNTQYELHERPPAPDPARTAGHRDTAIYFACPDVDAAYEHLRSRGVEVKKPVITRYGFKALSLRDPDGYGLIFHWPVK